MTPDYLAQLRTRAVASLREGRPDRVEALCRVLLACKPDEADGWHLCGLGRPARDQPAAAFIGRAIRIVPEFAPYHANLALVQTSRGNVSEAARSYKRAICLRVAFPEALGYLSALLSQAGDGNGALSATRHARIAKPDDLESVASHGRQLAELGRLGEAIQVFSTVLCLDPGNFSALNSRGAILCQLGSPLDAVSLHMRLLRASPDYAEAYSHLGNALSELRRYGMAAAAFMATICLKPGIIDGYNNRGAVLEKMKLLNSTAASYAMALKLSPELALLHTNAGVTAIGLHRIPQATDYFRRALCLEPSRLRAIVGLANLFREERQLARSLALFRLAIMVDPADSFAHNDRGTALLDGGEADLALAAFTLAICLKPDQSQGHSNRGTALAAIGKPGASLSSYRKASLIEPDLADAHYNCAFQQLLLGDFAAGWSSYEWRWSGQVPGFPGRAFAAPRWQGEALNGRRILLHAEQGLGDAVQFCRYARVVAEMGGEVLLEVPRPLVGVMGSLSGVSAIFAGGEPLPDFDLHCPLMSLPRLLQTRVETIPADTPYLVADRHLRKKWRDRLPAGERRVGLVWRGNPDHKHDWARSVPIEQLSPMIVAACAHATFVSVQKDTTEAERAFLAKRGVAELGSGLQDFADTAALLSELDLLISVDTSVAHLAGALGRPVWIALAYAPDWRWLLERDDSPWYPSAKLFRQTVRGEWPDVFDRMKAALKSGQRKKTKNR